MDWRRLPAALTLLAAGCGRPNHDPIPPAVHLLADGSPAPSRAPALRIDRLYLDSAEAGVPFHTIVGNVSSLGVAGSGFTPSCQVYFDGTSLSSQVTSDSTINVPLDEPMIAAPHRYEVQVRDERDPARRSNAAIFEVRPRSREPGRGE